MTEPSWNSNLSGSCFERYPGFFLNTYDKMTDTETGFKRRVLLTVFKRKWHAMSQRAARGSTRVGQTAEGVRGKYEQKPLWWFSREEMGEAG